MNTKRPIAQDKPRKKVKKYTEDKIVVIIPICEDGIGLDFYSKNMTEDHTILDMLIALLVNSTEHKVRHCVFNDIQAIFERWEEKGIQFGFMHLIEEVMKFVEEKKLGLDDDDTAKVEKLLNENSLNDFEKAGISFEKHRKFVDLPSVRIYNEIKWA